MELYRKRERGSDMVTAAEKSPRKVWPPHLAQMGCYFVVIEEELRIRPTHGFIVLGGGTRHRVENTPELRAWVLDVAGQIWAARARLGESLPVNPRPGQCRPCGMLEHCGQARL
jgi:CRISPR-associated exonuclease Cas4